MLSTDDWFDLAFESFKKIIFPESWLHLDVVLAKQDLIALLLIEKLGECTMSQIADHLNFPLSTTTGIVDRLVKKDLARRLRSESDRRLVMIELTEAGERLSQDFKTRITGVIDRIRQLLSEEELAVILKLLSRLSEFFEETDEDSARDENVPVQKIVIE